MDAAGKSPMSDTLRAARIRAAQARESDAATCQRPAVISRRVRGELDREERVPRTERQWRRLAMDASTSSCLIFAVILAQAVPLAAQGAAGSDYHKAQEILLGGDGGWDYLTFDQGARRLYISRSTQVIVFDPDSDKTVGIISDTPGVH